MYRLLCDEKDISYGQRYLLDLVDKRSLAKFCRDNNFDFLQCFRIAVGKVNPPVIFISQLTKFIHPVLWFYTESEPKPIMKEYKKIRQPWDFKKSIICKKIAKIDNLKAWSDSHGITQTSFFLLAKGKRKPSFLKIKELREIFNPSDWFFSEEKEEKS